MVDKDLLRNCVEIFVSMGMGSLDAYTQDFEEALCQGTTVLLVINVCCCIESNVTSNKEYYARKSQEWVTMHSTPDYMIKVVV